ncbi:hypothetical protein [Mesorhizobium sp. A556]
MMWFKRNDDQADNVLGLCDELTKAFAVGEHEAEVLPVTPAPPTILDRTASSFSAFLSDARSNEARLVNERAALDARYAEDCAANDELLRQTRLVIKSVGPALTALDDGYDPGDDGRKSYEVAIAAKRKRSAKPVLIAAE